MYVQRIRTHVVQYVQHQANLAWEAFVLVCATYLYSESYKGNIYYVCVYRAKSSEDHNTYISDRICAIEIVSSPIGICYRFIADIVQQIVKGSYRLQYTNTS